MNESSCDRAVERLLSRLEQSGLIERLELSDEDIADAIWLALHMGFVEPKIQKKQPNDSPQTSQEIPQSEKNKSTQSTTEKQSTQTAADLNLYSQDPKHPKQSENETNTESSPFQAPAAPALQNKLSISRSLRPLMRKVPSTIKIILDAEATVTRIAEQNIWLPVAQPQPERWLDLELVVEESRSSFIWTETIDEFQKLLQNQGAFRTVRVWNLSITNTQQLQLTRRKKGGQKSRCQHRYRELIHSNGRGLILVVSDCVSDIWQHKTIYRWLQKWSQKVPTAIVQLFPERLWQSSQLGFGYKLPFRAFNPGVANSDLVLPSVWAEIKEEEDIKAEKTLKLPVVTLEALSLRNWAKVIAGYGKINTPGFVLDLDFVGEQIEATTTTEPQEISPESLVDQFLATASPTAQQLAGLMAAAPVSLPVVNLIQKIFLPHQSTPVNVAEVFLSGMIQRTNISETDQPPQYDFVPNVRKLLNLATRLGETEAVLDVVSRYVAENLDSSINSFPAFLSRYKNLNYSQQEELLPFAQVAAEVLENLGGEYAQLASELRKTGGSHTKGEVVPTEGFPPLKTCEFRIATISIEEEPEVIDVITLKSFEFEVARIEVNPYTRPRLTIHRQQQENQYFTEDCNGVELEMVQIPGGTFIMGAPKDEEGSYDSERPRHQVTVPPFFIGKYPITQAQWQAVAFLPQVNRELDPNPARFKGENRPVESISWYDAVEFCDRLSQYTERQYRLPSEAEWEYACRAGTTTPFHFGETITPELANYNAKYTYGAGVKGNSSEGKTPVGSFKVANAFGLYDMHGNVWEWCLDDWHSNYKGAPTDGSAWFDNDDNLAEKEGRAVLRGGSWFIVPDYCRSATRYSFNWRVNRYYNNGFRVVCGFVAP